MWDPQITIEEVNDPVEIAKHQEHATQFKRNCDWVESHWHDLLPQAFDKFLAVAGQEPFLADTAEEARALAMTKYPEEKGLFLDYVMPVYGQSCGLIRLRGM